MTDRPTLEEKRRTTHFELRLYRTGPEDAGRYYWELWRSALHRAGSGMSIRESESLPWSTSRGTVLSLGIGRLKSDEKRYRTQLMVKAGR